MSSSIAVINAILAKVKYKNFYSLVKNKLHKTNIQPIYSYQSIVPTLHCNLNHWHLK